MPLTRKRPRVVLCATLTADGKLDASASAVPLALYGDGTDLVRRSWTALYDEAAGILADLDFAAGWEVPTGAKKPTTVLNSALIAGWPPAQQRKALLGALRGLGAGFSRIILCPGGAGLFRLLLDARLADELRLLVRPVIDGRRGSASLSGGGGGFFPASVVCRLVGMEPAGDACLLHYRILHKSPVAA